MKTITYLFAILALGACGGSTIDPGPAPSPSPAPGPAPHPEPHHVDADDVPAAPTPTPPKAATPTTIATGLDNPAKLALDATTVYFTSGHDVVSCKKTGCGGGPSVLSVAQDYITSVVVSGGEVFFSTGKDVRAVPVDGGTTRTVASDSSQTAYGLTVDESSGLLYWAVGSTIVSCAKTCAAPTTVASSEPGKPVAVTTRNGKLYWAIAGEPGGPTKQGKIRGCSIDACTPHTFADQQNASQELVVTDTSLHWIADGESTVRSCSLPACASITDAPRAGQTGIAVDDTRTYWSYWANGWIWTCTGATCEQPAEFATGIVGAGSLAVDDTNIYVAAAGWTDTGPHPYAPNAGFIAVLPKAH